MRKSDGIPRICESIFSKLLTLEVGDIRPPLRIEVKLDLGILPLMTLRLPKSSTASVFTKFWPPLIWRKNSQLQEVKFEQSLFWFSQGVDFRFQIYRNQHDQNHATLLLAVVSRSFVTKLCIRWLSVSWFYIDDYVSNDRISQQFWLKSSA